MRIRVRIDIRKPIKRRMKIKKAGEEGMWANFKYERLPRFCFFCGIIGHCDKFCEKFFDFPDKTVEKLFGPWLRAPARRTNYTGGERWLRAGPSEDSSTSRNGGQDRMAVDIAIPTITAQTAINNYRNKGNIRNSGGSNERQLNLNDPVCQ